MSNQRFASVRYAIEDTPEEAENMKLRSILMMALKNHINGGTLMQGGTTQSLGAVTMTGGTLQLADANPSVTDVANAASWTGSGGTVWLDTELGGDSSPSDKLVITGNATGTTYLRINVAGGAGAQTAPGGGSTGWIMPALFQ